MLLRVGVWGGGGGGGGGWVGGCGTYAEKIVKAIFGLPCNLSLFLANIFQERRVPYLV